MNKIMKYILITGIFLLLVGTIIGTYGYCQGDGINGLKKAFPNSRIEFN